MKVLITATVQSHICQFHRPLVDMLHQHGAEVHVAARNNLEEKNGLSLDFVEKVYDIPFSRSPKSLNNIAAYKQLKSIIDEGAYDIVHCNTPVGGVVTRLASRNARKQGTKVFYTAHGFHFYKGAPCKNWIFIYPIEKYLSNFTDTLITINTEDYALARNNFSCKVVYTHGVGVSSIRFSRSIEASKQEIRTKLGLKSNQPIILCVGELLPNKNQQMAIRAMVDIVKTYPESLLLLAGNGPERNKLYDLVYQCGLQNNIKLLGYCTNIEQYYSICDVLISCSKREGLPLNIVEAMFSQTPIVATMNRGNAELVKDGVTGFLVPIDDYSLMASKILDYLNNSEITNNVVNAAFAFVDDYSSCNVLKELEDIYSTALCESVI